jgi:hypothetical protein
MKKTTRRWIETTIGFQLETAKKGLADLQKEFTYQFKWVSENTWKMYYKAGYLKYLLEELDEYVKTDNPDQCLPAVERRLADLTDKVLGHYTCNSTSVLANVQDVWELECHQELRGFMKEIISNEKSKLKD